MPGWHSRSAAHYGWRAPQRSGAKVPGAAQEKAAKPEEMGLQLVGTEVVENKIPASRLVMAVVDKVHAPLEDLKVRMQPARHRRAPNNDILRPEVLIPAHGEQWANSGMPGDAWSMVNDGRRSS